MHLLGRACIESRRGKVLERQGKHSAGMLAGAKTGGPDGLGLREGERQRGHAWTRMQESGMHLLGGACIGSRRGKVQERQGKHSAWMLAGAKTGAPDCLREGGAQGGGGGGGASWGSGGAASRVVGMREDAIAS